MSRLQSKPLHDVTEIVRARAGSNSLKTTIPHTMVRQMGLNDQDALRWEYILDERQNIVGAKVTKEDKKEQ